MNRDIEVSGLDFYSKESRYRNNKVYQDEDKRYYLEPPSPIEIRKSEGDAFYEVNKKTENRLDLIARDVYNNSKLWWVIAEANKLNDPLDIPIGTTLMIPSMSTIFGERGVVG